MPRTKLGELYSPPKHPPVDHVKALVLERAAVLGRSPDELAAGMGVSRATWFARKRQPSAEWPLGELLAICRSLDVDIDELRGAVKYPPRGGSAARV